MTDDQRRIRLDRRAVRLLPITAQGRVLLLQCIRPDAPDAPFWVTTGGGIEADEDERSAAVRELWEETGIHRDPADLRGPLAHETIEFGWAEFDIVQQQSYYVVETPETTVSFANMEVVEIATTLDYRWWSLAELRTTSEHVLGNQLAVIEKALADPA